MRSFVSIVAVLVGALGATGCYDLSDPSGPRREDFMQSEPAAQPVAEGQAQDPAQQEALAETTTTTQALETLHPRTPKSGTAEDEEEARRKLRIVR